MKKQLFCLAILGLLLTGTLFSQSITDGLAGYWPLNGNADDESGNNNHGTEYGGITYITGKRGLAANFNGVDGRITTSSSTGFNNIIGSICFWFILNDDNSH